MDLPSEEELEDEDFSSHDEKMELEDDEDDEVEEIPKKKKKNK